jgi:hypothetical protein
MHGDENEATVMLHGLMAGLCIRPGRALLADLHIRSASKNIAAVKCRDGFWSQVFHHRCIINVQKLVCQSVQQNARQTMSTCCTILQAAERGGGSEETSNSVTLPGCRGLGTNPAMGQLPELLPAVLMTHQAFQQLQLQLLPFQVRGQQ